MEWCKEFFSQHKRLHIVFFHWPVFLFFFFNDRYRCIVSLLSYILFDSSWSRDLDRLCLSFIWLKFCEVHCYLGDGFYETVQAIMVRVIQFLPWSVSDLLTIMMTLDINRFCIPGCWWIAKTSSCGFFFFLFSSMTMIIN